MRPAIACLLLLGLGFAFAALASARGPAPRAIATVTTAPPAFVPAVVSLADAPKTSPPV